MILQRGTSPFAFFYIGALLDTFDIDTQLYLTFEQNGKPIIELTQNDLYYDYEHRRLIYHFKQQETMLFNKRLKIYVQLRVKYSDGTAIKSKIITVETDSLLKEGII